MVDSTDGSKRKVWMPLPVPSNVPVSLAVTIYWISHGVNSIYPFYYFVNGT